MHCHLDGRCCLLYMLVRFPFCDLGNLTSYIQARDLSVMTIVMVLTYMQRKIARALHISQATPSPNKVSPCCRLERNSVKCCPIEE